MAPKTPPPLTPAQLVECMGRWRMDHGDPIDRLHAMDWARYLKTHGYHTQAVFVNFMIDGVPGMVVLYSTAQSTGLQRAGQDCLKSSGDILYQCNSVCNFVCSCIKSYENQTAFRILYWYVECIAYPGSIVPLRRSMSRVVRLRWRRTGRGSRYLLRIHRST